MIDAITSKPTAAPGAKTTAAKSVQGNFQSTLASTAAKVTEPQDSLQISGMSDWEKLAELKRLHEQTDYSGMTEVEKYKLINDRFESCFPIAAMQTNIYGPIEMYGPTNKPMRKYCVRDHVVLELEHEMKDAGVQYTKRRPVSLRRQAYYDGMSDQEIIAAVEKKYDGDSMTDRAGALYELAVMNLDGNGGKTCLMAIDAMRSQLLRQTGGAFGSDLSAGSPWQESKIEQFAMNTKISWAALGQMLKEYANQNGEDASLDWLLEELGKGDCHK